MLHKHKHNENKENRKTKFSQKKEGTNKSISQIVRSGKQRNEIGSGK